MEGVYRNWVKTYGNEKGQLTLYKAVGCDKCGGSGMKGRCGLHELLIATDPLKKLIAEKARVAEMLAVALEELVGRAEGPAPLALETAFCGYPFRGRLRAGGDDGVHSSRRPRDSPPPGTRLRCWARPGPPARERR